MKKLLCFLLALTLMMSLGVGALAVTNSITIDPSRRTDGSPAADAPALQSSSTPGPEDIRLVGDDQVIRMPRSDEYLPYYSSLYVKAPKGHSVYVLRDPVNKKAAQPVAYHGSAVTALAESGGYTCCLYIGEANVRRAGWIPTDYLVYDYPGICYTNGKQMPSKSYHHLLLPDTSVSKDYFYGTKSRYTLINYPPEDAFIAVALEYQILSRQGLTDCSGPRDIYLNDGSGWDYFGTFQMDDASKPAQLTVYLERPMQIKAAAVIPQNSKLEKAVIRLHITGLYYDE